MIKDISNQNSQLNPLKLARAKRQLSIRKLAPNSGISTITISFLETGQRHARFGTLYILAETLQIPIEELLPLQDITAPLRGRKGGLARVKNNNPLKFSKNKETN